MNKGLRDTLVEIERAAHDLESHCRHHRQTAERRGRRLTWMANNKPGAASVDARELEEARAVLARLKAAYELTQQPLEEFQKEPEAVTA